MTIIFPLACLAMFLTLALRLVALFRKVDADTYLAMRFMFWSAVTIASLTDPTGPFTRWDLVFTWVAGVALLNVCWDAQIASKELVIELDVDSEPSDAPTPEVAAKALNDLATWFEGPEVATGLPRRAAPTAESLRALSEYLLVAEKRP